MNAQAVYEAAMEALRGSDDYFVELERRLGLTQTQINTYLRDYNALSDEEKQDLERRNGVASSGLGFHSYLSERIREGAGK